MSLPARDRQGHLADLGTWNEAVAEALAREEGIELTPAHWELIRLIRQFYQHYQVSPAMRPLVKYARQHLDAERATSLYLMTLFPESPARLLAKIAGLPRPSNCL